MKSRRYTRFTFLTIFLAIALLCLPSGFAQMQSEVYIRSTPSGASIAINGKTAGVTPLALPVLAPGKHLVVAALRGFRTLYKTIVIEPDQRTVLDLPLEPLTGLLLIQSTPAGAEIEINGVHRGSTPVLVAELPLGSYRVLLAKPGFLPRQIDITIDSRQPKRIHTALTTDTATLTVKAVPEGAAVSLDGIRQGNTPCTIENVRTGEVSINISATGYRLFAETLSLQAGEHREIEVALQPEPSSLSISTTPPDARLTVNEQFRGRSPVKISNIAAGEYTIRAELDAHDNATRTVRVGLGRDHVEEIALTANAGRLEITTEPANASVLLNGMPVGETVPEPGKTDNISARLTLPLVPVGTHDLTLNKVGYFPLVRKITIVRNETMTAHYSLERRFIPNVQVQTSTETYRGILIERNSESLKLELRPGIFKTLYNTDIITVNPLLAPEIHSNTP